MSDQDLGEALGWGDSIRNEGGGSAHVDPGVYGFEVQGVDRGQFNGSERMRPCPIAKVRAKLTDGPGAGAVLTANIYLNSRQIWKIGQFFRCIGMWPANPTGDDSLRPMDWTGAVGRTGRCEVRDRSYNGKTYSDLNFLEPERPGQDASPHIVPRKPVPAPAKLQAQVSQTFNGAVQGGTF